MPLRFLESCGNRSAVFCGFQQPPILEALSKALFEAFLERFGFPHFIPQLFSTGETTFSAFFRLFLLFFKSFPLSATHTHSTPIFLCGIRFFKARSTPIKALIKRLMGWFSTGVEKYVEKCAFAWGNFFYCVISFLSSPTETERTGSERILPAMRL